MKVRARLVTLAGVAAASLLLTAVPASADSGTSVTYMRDFVGTWVNPDTDAYSTVKIWRDDRGRARVKIWGACVPTACLIGTFTAEKFHFDTIRPSPGRGVPSSSRSNRACSCFSRLRHSSGTMTIESPTTNRSSCSASRSQQAFSAHEFLRLAPFLRMMW